MKCIYCNKEIRDGAKYCSECGSLQETNYNSEIKRLDNINFAITYILKNKKILMLLVAIIVVIIGISIIKPKNKKASIIGTWHTENGYEISFGSKSGFTKGTSTSGAYEIYEDNKLVMKYNGFDYIDRNTWSYVWSKENKGKEDYWYISGNALYIGNNKYTKK